MSNTKNKSKLAPATMNISGRIVKNPNAGKPLASLTAAGKKAAATAAATAKAKTTAAANAAALAKTQAAATEAAKTKNVNVATPAATDFSAPKGREGRQQKGGFSTSDVSRGSGKK